MWQKISSPVVFCSNRLEFFDETLQLESLFISPYTDAKYCLITFKIWHSCVIGNVTTPQFWRDCKYLLTVKRQEHLTNCTTSFFQCRIVFKVSTISLHACLQVFCEALDVLVDRLPSHCDCINKMLVINKYFCKITSLSARLIHVTVTSCFLAGNQFFCYFNEKVPQSIMQA